MVGGDWLPAMAGDDGIWRTRVAEVPRTGLQFLCFLGTFVLLAQFLCQRICICTSPCTVCLTINTGMLAKKSYVPGKRQLSLCTESLPIGRRPFVEASHQNERASREEVPKARSAAAGAAASVLERAARDTAVAALRAAAAERAA
jgi:hypothetical protein